MAVYQGARLRGAGFPAAGVDEARSRTSVPASAEARQRVRPTGLLMAAIVAATMLGLVYLTQTLGSHATTAEIVALEAKGVDLQTKIQQSSVLVMVASDEDNVRAKASKLKLKKLGVPLVLRTP